MVIAADLREQPAGSAVGHLAVGLTSLLRSAQPANRAACAEISSLGGNAHSTQLTPHTRATTNLLSGAGHLEGLDLVVGAISVRLHLRAHIDGPGRRRSPRA